VPLPEGASVVRFEFRPRYWEVGLAATLIAWLGIALAGAALLRERAVAGSASGPANGRVARVPRPAGEVAWR